MKPATNRSNGVHHSKEGGLINNYYNLQRRSCGKILTNIFLLIIIPLLLLDSFPPVGRFLSPLAPTVDQLRSHSICKILLDRAGIWQIRWGLFAPAPILERLRLSAELTFEDNQTTLWESPNITQMTWWEWKMRNYRMLTYVRNVQSPSNRKQQMYQGLVQHLAETQTRRDILGNIQHPIHIKLYRHLQFAIRSPKYLAQNMTIWERIWEPIEIQYEEEKTRHVCDWNFPTVLG